MTEGKQEASQLEETTGQRMETEDRQEREGCSQEPRGVQFIKGTVGTNVLDRLTPELS